MALERLPDNGQEVVFKAKSGIIHSGMYSYEFEFMFTAQDGSETNYEADEVEGWVDAEEAYNNMKTHNA